MEKISQIQNQELQLKRLAAQRRIYDDVREVNQKRSMFTVYVALGWILFATVIIGNGIITAIGGVAIFLMDWLLFENRQKSLQAKAAGIQELFDCDVLQMKWNHASIGLKPTAPDVEEAAHRYHLKPYPDSPIENWYGTRVDELPLCYGRIVCQRSNLSYDANLRRNYVKSIYHRMMILAALVAVGLGVRYLFVSSQSNLLYISLGALFGFLITSFKSCISEIKANLSAAKSLDNLIHTMDTLWNLAFREKATEAEVEEASRNWQNDIYRHRISSPVLPGEIYTKYRDSEEGKMHRSIDALVDEAKRLLKKLVDKENDSKKNGDKS